jgi:hypothetical protein
MTGAPFWQRVLPHAEGPESQTRYKLTGAPKYFATAFLN